VEAAVAYARAVGEYQPPAPPAVATEAEGLRLHLSSSSSTGYKGVGKLPSGRYQAQHGEGGREYLGTFDTAVEAAVAYARAVGESEGPQEAGRADPATDPELAPPPPSAPVPPPPPASTSASTPSAAASAPPEFSAALRDELLELYDRREACGGVLHPEAQRRFEHLKAAKAAAARSSGAPADTFSASLGYHDTPSWVAEAPAWVLAAAAAEGLTLVRSTNNTGFAHVLLPAGANKATPFMLRCAMEEGGPRVVEGYYASAAEAALVYARRVGPEASAHEHRMRGGARLMTAAQALAAAEAEGLTLERPHHNSRRKEARYKYVHLDQEAASRRGRPYRLVIRGEGKRQLKGGRYATAEQAALEAARYHAACARKN